MRTIILFFLLPSVCFSQTQSTIQIAPNITFTGVRIDPSFQDSIGIGVGGYFSRIHRYMLDRLRWSASLSRFEFFNGSIWQVLAYQGESSGGSRTFLASDVVNSNATANTLADVTGLSFSVTSGQKYKFKFFIVYTAAATTTGSRWTINGPTTSALHYFSEYTLTATSKTLNAGLGIYNSPAASNASSLTANNIVIMEGIFIATASGTLVARFASEIASSAITAKASVSFVEWQQL